MPRHTSLVIDDDRPCFAECEADWAKNEDRLRALEKLVRDQHAALVSWYAGHRGRCGAPDDDTESLLRRACELVSPPGFDPSTEGP